MRYIKSTPEFANSFCVGVAGNLCHIAPRCTETNHLHHSLAYPDGHPDAENNEDAELDHLKAKVDAGAEFIVTQLFHDVDRFISWLKRVREKGKQTQDYSVPI